MDRNIGYWTIVPAQNDELSAIMALLETCQLPSEDLPQHMDGILVAKDEEQEMVGVIALELVGKNGLMRSLAVVESHRGFGVARDLVKTILKLAVDKEVRDLYLMTTTATEFFPQFGFRRMARSYVPQSIKETQQYKHYCPQTATVMHRSLC